MGDADARLRWRGLHGLSQEEKRTCVSSCLIFFTDYNYRDRLRAVFLFERPCPRILIEESLTW
jgi:hypothetical protein